MSGKDFGGKISVSSSLGYKLSLRGTINVMGSNSSNEPQVNQDGSVDRIASLQAPSVELSFRDDGLDWSERLTGVRENITINEELTGVQHLFTDAFWSGRPTVNRANGELTGVTIVASYYRRRG